MSVAPALAKTPALADVPVLTTARLTLRGPQARDLDAMAAFYQSDRSAFVGGPCGRFDAWTRLLGGLGHWALRGFGWWSVECRETGAMAGRVGIGLHEGWDEPELGWHIYDGFEGRGYAHEAALAARRFAARTWGIVAPISYVEAKNARSRALAERLGAVVEREGEVVGQPCLVYRHPADAAGAECGMEVTA